MLTDTAHAKASRGSKELCDELLRCLQNYIPNLKRKEVKKWCALYSEGRRRFAYISHRTRLDKIEVWCLGDPDELQGATRLEIFPRANVRGGWEQSFQSRFFIYHLSDIKEACKLLYTVSYQES